MPPEMGHMRWLIHADGAVRAMLRGPSLSGADVDALRALVAGLSDRAGHLDPMARAMFVDLSLWLPDDILTKVDRMSMAVSLEARVPFLDHRLVEYVARLPSSQRVAGQRTKILMRQVVADLLPAEVLNKPKEGFSIPMKNWLRRELRAEAESVFDPARLRRHDFLDPDSVWTLWREHVEGVANHAHVLFAMLIFDLWHEEVVESAPPVEVGSFAP
jgi:asparagine synthase (glutamine-hydrolysing)